MLEPIGCQPEPVGLLSDSLCEVASFPYFDSIAVYIEGRAYTLVRGGQSERYSSRLRWQQSRHFVVLAERW